MALPDPRALSPLKLDAGRPNAHKSTPPPRTAQGKVRSLTGGLCDACRFRLYSDLMLTLMNGSRGTVGRVAQEALPPDEAAHGRFSEFLQKVRKN